MPISTFAIKINISINLSINSCLLFHRAVILRTFTVPRIIVFLLVLILPLIYYGLNNFNSSKDAVSYPNWKWKHSACGVPVQNDPILKVSNRNTYLVSAYVEHRKQEKQILTIAIMLRNDTTEYYCLLCCKETLVSVPASYAFHSDHFEFIYGTADVVCKVPETCPTATHVGITSRSMEDESLHNVSAFLPIRNQQTQENFPYEFTVCISTMFEYMNVLMLVQAMELFKILGVQRVVVYKTSCSPDVQKVLDYYVDQNFVELIPWRVSAYIDVSRGWHRSMASGDLHYFGQIPALNDCLYRYMYQSHYVALHDVDEYILPLKLRTWSELLPVLEEKYGHNVCFRFNNFFFPIMIRDLTPEYSPPSWKKVFGDNILECIYRANNNPTQLNPSKTIVNPRLVFQPTVHDILQSVNGTAWVDADIAHMYHVRNISNEIVFANSVTRDTRLRDYADMLSPAVSKVLQRALDIQ